MNRILFTALLLAILLSPINALAQKVTVSGLISDSATGEPLIGAMVKSPDASAVANNGGFYSLTLATGEHTLEYSFIGCASKHIRVNARRDTVINVRLVSDARIDESTVVGMRSAGFNGHSIGAFEIPLEQIRLTPTLLGESDILKTLQLLPGVQSGVSGFSGLYVRGGGPDENLLMLDGMTMYNAEHMLGLFSVFMPEAVKKVSFYKSAFPARYGSRVSSVLDVRTNDGNTERRGGSFGLNLLGTKLHLEGPVDENGKTTYSFSSRVMNTLLLQPFVKYSKRDERGNYWFYDLDGKITHRIGRNDKISLNVYNGMDYMMYNQDPSTSFESFTDTRIRWGNTQVTGVWNHIMSPKLYSTVMVGYNRYRMKTKVDEKIPKGMSESKYTQKIAVDYNSGINDLGTKADFEYSMSSSHFLRFGADYTFHKFSPETYGANYKDMAADEVVNDTTFIDSGSQIIYGSEFSFYAEDEMRLSSRLSANPGLRLGLFMVGGKTYVSAQPRLSVRYDFNDRLAVKGGYSRMSQNVHLLTSTQLLLPMDLWVPVTENIRPMISDQFSVGLFYDKAGKWEMSLETYYKSIDNVLEYKDGVPLIGNSAQWQDKVESGIGRSYGAELFIRKYFGKTSGWLSYSLSKTERRFPDGIINRGEWFPYKYDRRHIVNLVVTHRFNEKIDLTASWTLSSGGVVTVPIRQTVILSPVGDELHQANVTYVRGNYRLAPSHLLNFSANYHRKNRSGRESAWNVSVYNVYNQMNPDLMVTEMLNNPSSPVYTAKREVRRVTIIPVMPSVGYTLNF